MRRILAGAIRRGRWWHKAMGAESDLCVHCQSGQSENLYHIFWQCVAWKAHRARVLTWCPLNRAAHLPTMMSCCGLVPLSCSCPEVDEILGPQGRARKRVLELHNMMIDIVEARASCETLWKQQGTLPLARDAARRARARGQDGEEEEDGGREQGEGRRDAAPAQAPCERDVPHPLVLSDLTDGLVHIRLRDGGLGRIQCSKGQVPLGGEQWLGAMRTYLHDSYWLPNSSMPWAELAIDVICHTGVWPVDASGEAQMIMSQLSFSTCRCFRFLAMTTVELANLGYANPVYDLHRMGLPRSSGLAARVVHRSRFVLFLSATGAPLDRAKKKPVFPTFQGQSGIFKGVFNY